MIEFFFFKQKTAYEMRISDGSSDVCSSDLDPIVGHEPLELLAGILAALIRVMQESIGLAAPPDRHDQRIGDELGCHVGTHRPSDHPAREQVDHRSNIEPRSEEHTSELQSLMRISYAVFCLKKKKHKTQQTHTLPSLPTTRLQR